MRPSPGIKRKDILQGKKKHNVAYKNALLGKSCEMREAPGNSRLEGCMASVLYAGEQYLKQRGMRAPRREAEMLLQSVLSCKPLDLYRDREQPVSKADQRTFSNLLTRRGQHEPIQYLVGKVDFCGLSLCIASGVFIPRPETELIVQIASSLPTPPQTVLDLCTGSGALALALARQFPEARIVATDCSDAALEMARTNQKRYGHPMTFLKGDLFAPLDQNDCFDLIVSNPPYVAEADTDQMDPEVRLYEPPHALFSPEHGQAHLRRILKEAPHFLARDGHLLLEIGHRQAPALLDFIKSETPFCAMIHPDWADIPRIIHGQWIKS